MSLVKEFKGFVILNHDRCLYSNYLFGSEEEAMEYLLDSLCSDTLTSFLDNRDIVVCKAALSYDARTVLEPKNAPLE